MSTPDPKLRYQSPPVSVGLVPNRARYPRWSEDELTLALDLYVRHGQLPASAKETVQLSRLLRRLAGDSVADHGSSFRSADAVAMKLANFAALDPGYAGSALQHGNQEDKVVWDKFANDFKSLRQAADSIRSRVDP